MSSVIFGATFKAQVDRNTLPAGETFVLQLEIDQQAPYQQPEPTSSFDSSLNILAGPSTRSSAMSINGKLTEKTLWSYEIQVTKEGEFTIPPFNFGGATTAPIAITVTKGPAAADIKDIVIKFEADKTTALVGEQIILKYKIYSKAQYRRDTVQKIQLPTHFDEVVLDASTRRPYDEVLDGERYQVDEFRQAIFAAKPGTYSIGPFTVSGRYRPSVGSSRRQQPFKLESKPLELTIKPLKTKTKTKQKTIPVTDKLQVSTQWEIPEDPIDIGEPIILEVHISAPEQSVNRLPDLEFKSSKALKIYSDGEESQQNQNWDRGITGYRTQRFAIIPQKAGDFTIPSTSITWWNTTKNAFETTKVKGQSISVTGGAPRTPEDNALALADDTFDDSTKDNSREASTDANSPSMESEAESEVWLYLSLVSGVIWLFTIAYFLKGKPTKESPDDFEDDKRAPQVARVEAKKLKKEKSSKQVQLDLVPILNLNPHDVSPRDACMRLIHGLCQWARQETLSQPANVTQLIKLIDPNDPWLPLLSQCEQCLYDPSNQTNWPKEAIREALVKGLPKFAESEQPEKQSKQGLAPFVP